MKRVDIGKNPKLQILIYRVLWMSFLIKISKKVAFLSLLFIFHSTF